LAGVRLGAAQQFSVEVVPGGISVRPAAIGSPGGTESPMLLASADFARNLSFQMDRISGAPASASIGAAPLSRDLPAQLKETLQAQVLEGTPRAEAVATQNVLLQALSNPALRAQLQERLRQTSMPGAAENLAGLASATQDERSRAALGAYTAELQNVLTASLSGQSAAFDRLFDGFISRTDASAPDAATGSASTSGGLQRRPGSQLQPYTGRVSGSEVHQEIPAADLTERPAAASVSARAARAFAPVVSFIGGLSLIQMALDARSTLMPTLLTHHYGHASVLAFAAISYNVAGIAGRLLGGNLLARLGLRRAYASSLGLRAAAFAGMAILLGIGALPLAALLGFVALDGFLYGAAYTMETVAPALLVGSDQAALERLSMWQQLLLPLVAFAVPVGVGALVSVFGFMHVLAAIPILFGAAALWFATTMRLPAGQAPVEAGPRLGLFASLRNGAVVVFKNPLLRVGAAGFIVYNMLNPLVLAIFAPMWSLLAGKAEAATSVYGWVAGLYSVGWLLAGVVMAAEQRSIKRRRLSPAESSRTLRKSLLTWMGLGAAALSALVTFMLSPAHAWHSGLSWAALTMIPFGLAQVLSSVKLRNFFQSHVPPNAMTDAMAFLCASALAAATLGMVGLKFLFGAMSGMAPFTVVAWSLPALALVYLGLTWTLARLTRTS
jgi:hypothetical protein